LFPVGEARSHSLLLRQRPLPVVVSPSWPGRCVGASRHRAYACAPLARAAVTTARGRACSWVDSVLHSRRVLWVRPLQVVFLCVLLAVSAQQFTNDAQKFIITPLESMSHPTPSAPNTPTPHRCVRAGLARHVHARTARTLAARYHIVTQMSEDPLKTIPTGRNQNNDNQSKCAHCTDRRGPVPLRALLRRAHCSLSRKASAARRWLCARS
jgi:hypothetical protein